MAEKNKKILIVDDMILNRKLLLRIFQNEYNVIEAEDGIKALEALRRHPDICLIVLDLMMPRLDGFGVLEQAGLDERLAAIPVIVVTANGETENQIRALKLGAADYINKPFDSEIVFQRVRNIIWRRESDKINQQNRLYEQRIKQQQEYIRRSEIDQKTGCLSKDAFCRYTLSLLAANPHKQYVLLRGDIDRFKVFNDIYGSVAGDKLLAEMGRFLRQIISDEATCGHLEADHFVVCLEAGKADPNQVLHDLQQCMSEQYPDFEFVPRLGAYFVEKDAVDVNLMCDRALMALRSTKGNFIVRFAYFDQSMWAELIAEQEIIGDMKSALAEKQFTIYLQPQVDYATQKYIGAEALVRWLHPQKGMIPPGSFIPLMESNGFIARLDEYVWEYTCQLLRKWLDEGIKPLPVSVNISRVDVYNPHLSSIICGLIKKYKLQPNLLRLEITESAYMENAKQLINFVVEMQSRGFVVEMDDFGSSYSSLNTLKDVPVDILKMDMKFLSGATQNSRGSNIMSSIVRMAHWLKLPVIAEGIETAEQADYLKSISCFYMQGYYFARPMPVAEYEQLLQKAAFGDINERFKGMIMDSAVDFWDASTQSTLLFNSYVGGAAIIEYTNGNVEALRFNDRFLEELGVSRREYLQEQTHLLEGFAGENRTKLWHMLETAFETAGETKCVIQAKPLNAESDGRWIKIRARYIAQKVDHYVFYIAIENITAQIKQDRENARLAQYLDNIIDSLYGAVLSLAGGKPEVKISFYSELAGARLGFDREELGRIIRNGHYSIVHPEDRKKVNLCMQELRSDPVQEQAVDFRHLHKDGSCSWVRMCSGLLKQENDGTYQVSVVFSELAEQGFCSEQA